jgi:hypothetical protein
VLRLVHYTTLYITVCTVQGLSQFRLPNQIIPSVTVFIAFNSSLVTWTQQGVVAAIFNAVIFSVACIENGTTLILKHLMVLLWIKLNYTSALLVKYTDRGGSEIKMSLILTVGLWLKDCRMYLGVGTNTNLLRAFFVRYCNILTESSTMTNWNFEYRHVEFTVQFNASRSFRMRIFSSKRQ